MYQRVKNHISPPRSGNPSPSKNLHHFASKETDPHLQMLRTSQRWVELRRMILAVRPVCEICARLSAAPRLATEIHHIVPAAVMIARHGDEGFFDLANLAPLCRRHHQRNESAWKNGTSASVFPTESRLKEADLWRE